MSAVSYKKILVPVDGSENAFKAVAHADYLACACGAEIGLIYALVPYKDLQVYTPVGTTYIPENFFTNAEEFGKKVLEEATAQLSPGVSSSTFLEIGSPADIIPKFAQNNKYDLIIMGSRGLGVLKELVMGSVSHYVMHNAKCPVMVIK